MVESEQYRGDLEEIPDLARSLAEGRPDAVIQAGVASLGTGPLLAAIDSRLPGVPLYAASGILVRPASIPAAPDSVEAVGPSMRPERAGYLSMRLVLDAVDAGGRDRDRVTAAALRLARAIDPPGLAVYRLAPDGRFRASFSPR